MYNWFPSKPFFRSFFSYLSPFTFSWQKSVFIFRIICEYFNVKIRETWLLCVTPARLGNKNDKKKNRHYQMDEKSVCFFLFEKFFASKPQMDVCLHSLLFMCPRCIQSLLSFLLMRIFSAINSFLFIFHQKKRSLMGYANGICNMDIAIFCKR